MPDFGLIGCFWKHPKLVLACRFAKTRSGSFLQPAKPRFSLFHVFDNRITIDNFKKKALESIPRHWEKRYVLHTVPSWPIFSNTEITERSARGDNHVQADGNFQNSGNIYPVSTHLEMSRMFWEVLVKYVSAEEIRIFDFSFRRLMSCHLGYCRCIWNARLNLPPNGQWLVGFF